MQTLVRNSKYKFLFKPLPENQVITLLQLRGVRSGLGSISGKKAKDSAITIEQLQGTEGTFEILSRMLNTIMICFRLE